MPYLHCPACHRTAWLRGEAGRDETCRRCGTALGPIADGEARYLARAVRERFARDARLNEGRPRFVRERR
jgi:hypothetical protein